MKVLVAEDEEISAQILYETLVNWGYEVVLVPNGLDAWEVLNGDEPPQIAILDWFMPGIDGIELCQRIRQKANNNQYTYVLMLSAKDEREDMLEGLKAGADDYLIKPFDPEILKVHLQNAERILNLQSQLFSMFSHMEDIEEERQEFVAAITHDLRTPIASEKRALEMIMQYKSEMSPRVVNLFNNLVSNNASLLELVNQIVESCYLESPAIHLHRDLTNFHELTAKVIQSVQPLADSKKIVLVNWVPWFFQNIMIDSTQMRRVLTNLVANAINNISEKCVVEIRAEVTPDSVEILVVDNGPGISPEMLPHLFERYYTTKAGSQKIGSGLGLFICKTIVELHQGQMHVESVLGRGTTFSLKFPKRVVLPQPYSQLEKSVVENHALFFPQSLMVYSGRSDSESLEMAELESKQ